MEFNTCPGCESAATESLQLNFAPIRHLDFETIGLGPVHLSRCPCCSLVRYQTEGEKLDAISASYRDPSYAETRKCSHSVIVPEFASPVTHQFLQAELLAATAKDIRSVLDIGCFDGTLLRAIDAKLTDVTLVGFDVAEGMRKQFPTDEKYSFVSGCLEQINRTFDLVVLSHSLQYIRDIHNLFRHFDRFLTENGRIFVQVPNFTMKPTSLLLGDLYYHYTPAILRNIFAQHGYRFETLSTPWFPRDILGMAVRDGSRLMKGLEDDCDVYKARDYLVSAADALRSAVFDDDNVGVLGTTFEATFVDSIIGEKIKFFVDENPNVVGHNFRRKPVFGPDYLTDADTLIIPYGETAHRIRDRFSRVYRGKFVLI